MSDELPSLKAAEYIRLITAEYGPAQAEDVLREMTCCFLYWLGQTKGRAEIDRLLRERLDPKWVRRTDKKIELVWSRPSVTGSAQ